MTIATQSLTIAQMSGAYGVTLRALRFYEQRGLLRPSRDSGERRYGSGDELRLQLILKGKRLGFSLEEVRRLILDRAPSREASLDATALLSRDQIEGQLALLEAQRDEIVEALDELRRQLARKDCEGQARAGGRLSRA